jgi:hypothetical protein
MDNIEKVYKIIDARGTDVKNAFSFVVPENGTYRIGSIISSPANTCTLYFSVLKKHLKLFASDVRHHTYTNNQTNTDNLAVNSFSNPIIQQRIKTARENIKKQYIEIELKKGDVLHGAYQLVAASASIGQVFLEKIKKMEDGLC